MATVPEAMKFLPILPSLGGDLMITKAADTPMREQVPPEHHRQPPLRVPPPFRRQPQVKTDFKNAIRRLDGKQGERTVVAFHIQGPVAQNSPANEPGMRQSGRSSTPHSLASSAAVRGLSAGLVSMPNPAATARSA